MTNEVVQSFAANTLLALGASSTIVIEPEEASQFVAIASVLLANVGILTRERAAAMCAAVKQAHHAKIPRTFDPVAVDALEFHRRSCLELLSPQPAVIRGNAPGVLALAGMSGDERGVDTADTVIAALPVAQALARQVGVIIVIAGEVDYVIDGQYTVRANGGNPLVTYVVSTRCAPSAVVAASCALCDDRLDNVASACSWMKRAGQIATEQSDGPGSSVPAFLNTPYNLNAQE